MLALLILFTISLFPANFLVTWITIKIGRTRPFKSPHLRLVFYLISGLLSVLGQMQMAANFFASRLQFLSQQSIDLWSTIALTGSLLSYVSNMYFTSRRLTEDI